MLDRPVGAVDNLVAEADIQAAFADSPAVAFVVPDSLAAAADSLVGAVDNLAPAACPGTVLQAAYLVAWDIPAVAGTLVVEALVAWAVPSAASVVAPEVVAVEEEAQVLAVDPDIPKTAPACRCECF